MKKFFYIFIIVLFSCGRNSSKEMNYDYPTENKDTKIAEEIIANSKATYYLDKMKSKNYSIYMNAPCRDALEEKKYKRRECVILKKEITEKEAIIHFKFKAACCQEFLGDYKIKNNELIFKIDKVNDVVCSCICWYHYELKINELDTEIKKIKFDFIDN